jgi:hypothetical protein
LDGDGKLVPVNTAGPVGRELPAAVERDPNPLASIDDRDPVTQWAEEHPDFDKETPEQQAAATKIPAELPPLDTTDDTPPADTVEKKPADKAVEETEKPAETKAAEVKAPEPKVEPTPAPANRYAADEKIALVEGDPEWSRAQIVAALKERQTLLPLKTEAEGFKEVFNMSAAEAKQNWAPILEKLADERIRDMAQVVIDSSPEKAEYLKTCADYFDKTAPPPEMKPAAAAVPVDPQLKKEVEELRAWRQQEEERSANARVQSELNEAIRRYPILADDKQLQADLFLTAGAMWRNDNTKTLLDALTFKAPMYEAMAVARAAKETAHKEPEPVVPASITSGGADPSATRPTQRGRKPQFADVDEATEAWLREHPE